MNSFFQYIFTRYFTYIMLGLCTVFEGLLGKVIRKADPCQYLDSSTVPIDERLYNKKDRGAHQHKQNKAF